MIWPLIRDFRCPFSWNDITEIIAKWEKWDKLNEWGPQFSFGYLLRHKEIGLIHARMVCDIPSPGYGHGDWTTFYDKVVARPEGYEWRDIGLSR